MFSSIISSPELLKLEATARVKAAITFYFDLMTASEKLNNVGVDHHSPSINLTKVFNKSLKDYFTGKSLELGKLNPELTASIEIGPDLFMLERHPSLLIKETGHGFSLEHSGWPVQLEGSEKGGIDVALSIADTCLDFISFDDIFNSYKEQFDGLEAKEKKQDADQLAILLGFQHCSGNYKVNKKNIAIIPDFYVTGELGGTNIGAAMRLQQLLANFSGSAYRAMAKLISAGSSLQFNEVLPNQVFDGTDLSISYFKTKNELRFTDELFDKIAAFICLYGSPQYAEKIHDVIANRNN